MFDHLFPDALLQAVIRGEQHEPFALNLMECVHRYVGKRLPPEEFPDLDLHSVCVDLWHKLLHHKPDWKTILPQGSAAFIRYICVVMRNYVFDQRRKLGVRQRHSAGSLDEPAGPDTDTETRGDRLAAPHHGVAEIEQRELLALLNDFIRQHLTAEEAIILRLIVLDELPYQEVATRLQRTVSDIGVKKHRLLIKLRKSSLHQLLKAEGY